MGNSQSAVVTPKEFYENRGLGDLVKDNQLPTAHQIMKHYRGDKPNLDGWKINSAGRILPHNIEDQEVKLGVSLLADLADGMSGVQANFLERFDNNTFNEIDKNATQQPEVPNIVARMVENIDKVKKMEQYKNQDIVSEEGSTSRHECEMSSVNIGSVAAFSDTLVAALSAGWQVPTKVCHAIIYPEIALTLQASVAKSLAGKTSKAIAMKKYLLGISLIDDGVATVKLMQYQLVAKRTQQTFFWGLVSTANESTQLECVSAKVAMTNKTDTHQKSDILNLKRKRDE